MDELVFNVHDVAMDVGIASIQNIRYFKVCSGNIIYISRYKKIVFSTIHLILPTRRLRRTKVFFG